VVEPDKYEEFASLLQNASGRIVAYLHALLLNWNDTEDVFQETCLVLWRKFEEFQPNTNFVGWALRIAQNNARNQQRTSRRRGKLINDGLQVSLLAVAADRSEEETSDSLAALAKCMDRLSEAERCLVQRCYGDRLPVQRVATQLGRSPTSVHHSLRRIRMRLVECINDVREDDR
jgi:RNA polymerase sigma-70 factor, ECF subfamily